jgi:hypothetical protein
MATAVSKKNNGIKIITGTKCMIAKTILPKQINVQENPAITFNNVCPAIIFANSRTDRLTIRKL